MNTSNKRLLTWIKVFFKTIYILLIVIALLTLLSQGITIFMDNYRFGSFPVLMSFDHPEISVQLNGDSLKPDAIFAIGGVVIKGVPPIINIINGVLTLTAMIIYILIVRSVRIIIRSIDRNEVFSLKNAGRLRTIGYLLLIDLILNYAAVYTYTTILGTIQSANKGYSVGLIVGDSLGYIIAIVFTFFMAAVFKIGVSLQEENQSFV